MRLISLEATNFKHLRGPAGGPLRIEFGEGVLGIRGPNESGKSSIMQAVFFALTGSPTEGGREIGHYVGYGAGRARVALEFEVGGRRYEVARTIQRLRGDLERGRSDAALVEVRPDGSRVAIARGAREVNARIEQMLGGIGPEELRSTVFIIQKDLDRLKKMERGERRELIDALIGRESFDRAKGALDGRRRELEGTPQRRGLIPEAEEELERLEEDLREYNELRRRLAEIEREVEVLRGPPELRGSIREAEAQEARLRGDLDALRAYKRYLDERRDLETRLQAAERRLEAVRSEISQLERSVERLKSLRGRLEEVSAKAEVLRGPPDDPRSIRWAEERLNRLRSVISRLEGLRNLLAERSRLAERLKSLEARARELRDRLEGIARDVEAKGRDLDRLQASLRSSKARLDALEGKVRLWNGVTAGLLLTGALLAISSAIAPVLLKLAAVPIGLGLAVWFLGSETREARSRLEGEVSAREGQVSKLRRELESARRLRLEEEGKLERIEEELTRLRVREGELKSKIREARSELEREGVLEPSLELSSPDSLEPTVEELRRELDEALQEHSRRRAALEDLERQVQELSAEVERLRDSPSALEGKRREREALEGELRELNQRLSGLAEPELPDHLRPFSEGRLEEVDRKHREALGELSARKERLRGLERSAAELSGKVSRLSGIEERVQEARRRLEDLRRELRVVRLARELIESAAEATRRSIRPAIESGMSSILPAITGGRYRSVRIDETSFDVSVYDSDAGAYVRLDRFSGGTVDQVLLAMRLAFTLSVIPRMRGTHPEFLFMDEVLASSDSDRRRQIMELVARNLRRSFAQIVVISHQEDVLRQADRSLVLREGEVVGPE